MLISDVASSKKRGSDQRKMMIIDARKAHLHAVPDREIYVELPPEVRRPGYCGRLKRCLYGTRDAPARWEAYLSAELRKHGFIQGKASACCFYHPGLDVRCVVHGDDFVFTGCDKALDWVAAQMEKSFLVKLIGRLGDGPGDVQEIRVLNRIVRWTAAGLCYEPDPRHAELLARGLASKGPAVKTPGAKEEVATEDGDRELDEHERKVFRPGAARANYLAMDRPDLTFVAKELCRRMASPRQRDMDALLRLAKYVAVEARTVCHYQWQEAQGLRVYSDTDFAGCHQTRKSTSGGCILRGSHLVKHWSSTQRVVTLSSGEAELAGIVKGAAEGLGLQSLAADLGIEVALQIHADSSAAIRICRRSGIGRVRHLVVGQLWVQEQLRLRAFELHKVHGSENPADALTKVLARDLLDKHLAAMAVNRELGRASSAPHIAALL